MFSTIYGYQFVPTKKKPSMHAQYIDKEMFTQKQDKTTKKKGIWYLFREIST